MTIFHRTMENFIFDFAFKLSATKMIPIYRRLCGGGNTCVERRDANFFAHIDHLMGFVHVVPSHIGYNLLSNTNEHITNIEEYYYMHRKCETRKWCDIASISSKSLWVFEIDAWNVQYFVKLCLIHIKEQEKRKNSFGFICVSF